MKQTIRYGSALIVAGALVVSLALAAEKQSSQYDPAQGDAKTMEITYTRN